MLQKFNNAFTMWTAIIATIAGGIYTLEGRYAHAQEAVDLRELFTGKIDKVETKLEFKVASDELYQTRERKWKLQDRLESNPNDASIRADLRELEATEQQLKETVDTLRSRSNFVLR